MLPHQERVVAERDELQERIEKLDAFLKTPVFAKLPEVDRVDLYYQLCVMRAYRDTLNSRISRF